LPDFMPFIGSLLIFLARVVDVSLGTLRIILLVRGKRMIAGALGFAESLIYIIALGFVVGRLNEPFSVIMYCLGFAAGNVVGSIIEEHMALGYTSVQVITLSKPKELCEHLRSLGYGVTVWEGEGREGRRLILNIALMRRELPRLLKIIDEWDLKAFVTILDTRATKGGILSGHKSK